MIGRAGPVGSVWRLDPSAGLIAIACYSLCFGLSLLSADDLFARAPAYAELARGPLGATAWGWVLIALSALLVVSMAMTSLALRVITAMLAGICWLYLGQQMLLAGWLGGYFSGIGAYSVVCGAGAMLATGQWVEHRANRLTA